ncbi:unnamed protein product [Lota lota]
MVTDSGSQSVRVLLNLSTTFDAADHSILLHRIKTYYTMVTDTAPKWFPSYLSNWKYHVNRITILKETPLDFLRSVVHCCSRNDPQTAPHPS